MTDERIVAKSLTHSLTVESVPHVCIVFGLYLKCLGGTLRRRDNGWWALQIQRLEGSRCGGGRLCNLNAPMDAGGRGIDPLSILIGAIRR